MKTSVTKSRKGWAIAGRYGLYTGWWFTRREAIDAHVRALYGGTESSSEAWKKCRGCGDRAVRVTITWNEEAKP